MIDWPTYALIASGSTIFGFLIRGLFGRESIRTQNEVINLQPRDDRGRFVKGPKPTMVKCAEMRAQLGLPAVEMEP